MVHDAGFATLSTPGNTRRVRRERTLPSYVAPGLRLLVCGLNPSLYAADAGVGFARPGNRFWPAMLAAGLASVDRDPVDLLTNHHVGMTDLVKRATPRASELGRDEYEDGVQRLDRLSAWLEPRVVCVVGLSGWRRVLDRAAQPGWQARGVGGRPAYLMPNPSGVNAHSTVGTLVKHLKAAAEGH
jgi:TDG/mug DNA glycosylase family protein